MEAYLSAFSRELREEVQLKNAINNQVVAVINDDSNEVGKVHFGVVHRIFLSDGGSVTAVDPALANGGFQFFRYVEQEIDQFESWSQMVIREFIHN
jgi:predicted NUDIX family phosphoesterase